MKEWHSVAIPAWRGAHRYAGADTGVLGEGS